MSEQLYLVAYKNGKPVSMKLLPKSEAFKKAADTGRKVIPVTLGDPVETKESDFSRVNKLIKAISKETSTYKRRFNQAWITLDKAPEKLKEMVKQEHGDPASELNKEYLTVYVTWSNNDRWSVNWSEHCDGYVMVGIGEMRDGFADLIEALS